MSRRDSTARLVAELTDLHQQRAQRQQAADEAVAAFHRSLNDPHSVLSADERDALMDERDRLFREDAELAEVQNAKRRELAALMAPEEVRL